MEAELTIGAVLGGDITLLSGTATVGGAEMQRLPQHDDAVNALCLLPASSFGAPKDAELIASGGADRRILIWNLATMAAHHRIDTSGPVYGVCPSLVTRIWLLEWTPPFPLRPERWPLCAKVDRTHRSNFFNC